MPTNIYADIHTRSYPYILINALTPTRIIALKHGLIGREELESYTFIYMCVRERGEGEREKEHMEGQIGLVWFGFLFLRAYQPL